MRIFHGAFRRSSYEASPAGWELEQAVLTMLLTVEWRRTRAANGAENDDSARRLKGIRF